MNIISRTLDLWFVFFCGLVNLSCEWAALCNRHSSCCERLSISAAAETSSTSFARSRYNHALLLSLNAKNTALAPDVCKRLCLLGIYDRNQTCPLWKGTKRPYRAGCRHRGKTVDTIRQKHPLTRYADIICSCFPICDGLLPTNLVGHLCSAQLADCVDQLGISPGSHRRRRLARKRPYRGGRCKQGWTKILWKSGRLKYSDL